MKIGDAGEAFFVFETDEDIPESIATSPLLEANQPGSTNKREQPTDRFGAKAEVDKSPSQDASASSQEPDFLDLNAEAKDQVPLPAGASPASDATLPDVPLMGGPSEESQETTTSSTSSAAQQQSAAQHYAGRGGADRKMAEAALYDGRAGTRDRGSAARNKKQFELNMGNATLLGRRNRGNADGAGSIGQMLDHGNSHHTNFVPGSPMRVD